VRAAQIRTVAGRGGEMLRMSVGRHAEDVSAD